MHKDAALDQNGRMDHPPAWLTLLPAVVAAISGIVGVFVGGLITFGIQYWWETRKDKRELRQAARLIDMEFSLASVFAKFAVQQQKWSDVPLAQPTTINWEKYHAVLATELSDTAWGMSVSAYGSVKQLIDLRSKGCDPDDRSKPSNTALKVAEFIRLEIEKGRAALAPFTMSEPAAK